MSTSLRVFFLAAILSTAVNAFAQINIVNFDFGAVRIACSNGYAYQAPLGACPYVGPTQNSIRALASDGFWEASSLYPASTFRFAA